MSCVCHDCKNKFRMDIIVSDEIWNKIRPDKSRSINAGLLCPVCIVKKIEDLLGYSAFILIENK